MKKPILIIALLMTIGLTGCGSSLEEGPCTDEVKREYTNTLGWFGVVSSRAGTYDSYDEYLAAYREPLEDWYLLEAKTTCDAALIDLMVDYLTTSPEDEDSRDIYNDIINFNVNTAHSGRQYQGPISFFPSQNFHLLIQ